jgi:hypothetical protein
VEKRSVRSVIRSQKQVIRAQNVLIDWLLTELEKQRRKHVDDSRGERQAVFHLRHDGADGRRPVRR